MPLLNKLSGAFPATLMYITAGVLIEIWSIVAFLVFPPTTDIGLFWTLGFMGTGIALFLIGIFLGRIGRSARTAGLPPEEVVQAVTQVEKMTAQKEEPPATPPAETSLPPDQQKAKAPQQSQTLQSSRPSPPPSPQTGAKQQVQKQ